MADGPGGRRATRRDPRPLAVQVLDDLRTRVASGEFKDRFPTDVELMSTYGVSRHTVRDAARRLRDEGIVEREQGRGSKVRTNRLEQPVGALYSLFRSIEDQGRVQRSIVRELDQREDARASIQLGLPESTRLVYLERVRFADDDPVAVDCSWLPSAIARPLLEVDFAHTALYDELTARCGCAPTSGWERIRPVLPTKEQRELLGTAPREPVFGVERLAFTNGRPLEWRTAVVRADRFSFVAHWSTDDGYVPELESDPHPSA